MSRYDRLLLEQARDYFTRKLKLLESLDKHLTDKGNFTKGQQDLLRKLTNDNTYSKKVIHMNWENKLKATGFLSLKNKDGDTFSYIKLDDAAKIAEMAYNEALDKVKEIYKDEADIVDTIKDLKL
jgi:hypothetical protein